MIVDRRPAAGRLRWKRLLWTPPTGALFLVTLVTSAIGSFAEPSVTADVPCVGDCTNQGSVTIADILTLVNIALDNTPCSACLVANCPVTIDQILLAVSHALNGCGTLPPTPTPSLTPTSTSTPPTTTVSSVTFTGSSGNYTVTIGGNGFGIFPPGFLSFLGDSSFLSIIDPAQLGHGQWGYTGDFNVLSYESWTDGQIQVSGFGGTPGDAVVLTLCNPSTNATAAAGTNVPPACTGTPQIASVQFSGNGQNLQITIVGSNFGSAPVSMPFSGDLNYLSFADWNGFCSGPPEGWRAGFGGWEVASPNTVLLNYQSWTDRRIEIDGFAGSYGSDGATLQMGDPYTINIWNTNDTTFTGLQTAIGGFVTTSVPTSTPTSGPCFAPLNDNFTADTALNDSLWIVNGPAATAALTNFTSPPSSVITPTLSFSAQGMGMSGVTANFEQEGIQSVQSFSPPFTLTTNVVPGVTNAGGFQLAISTLDGGAGVSIVGGYTASWGFLGLTYTTPSGPGTHWAEFPLLHSSLTAGTRFTLTISVDPAGTATISGSPTGMCGGQVSLSVGSVGQGPFYVVISQGSGAQPSPGPNLAYWQSAQVVCGASSMPPMCAPTGAACTTGSECCSGTCTPCCFLNVGGTCG